MALVGRLGGAILAETESRFYLVGDLKVPVDFAAVGFVAPADTRSAAFIELQRQGELHLESNVRHYWLLEGEALAQRLADFFVIRRNGSVSDRLWRLVTESSVGTDLAGEAVVDSRWLGPVPAAVWEAVRETVLSC